MKMMKTLVFLDKTKVVELNILYNSSVNGAPDQLVNDGLWFYVQNTCMHIYIYMHTYKYLCIFFFDAGGGLAAPAVD